MSEPLQRRRRAWEFAHKLLSIIEVIPRREGKALLVVRTEEICKAMGVPHKAKLEQVQRFVFDVVAFMRGYGMYIACGCGYLSLMVCSAERHEQIIENRDATAFLPESVDDYFDKFVLSSSCPEEESVDEICDFDEPL